MRNITTDYFPYPACRAAEMYPTSTSVLLNGNHDHAWGQDLYDHVIKFDQCFYIHCPQPYVCTMYVKARVKLENKIIQILRGNFKSSQRSPTYQQNTPTTTLLNNNLPAPKHIITFTHISQNFTHNPEHTTSAIFCVRKKNTLSKESQEFLSLFYYTPPQNT